MDSLDGHPPLHTANMRRFGNALAALSIAVVSFPAPQPRAFQLGPIEGSLPQQGFTRIGPIGELADGRVVIPDARDHILYIADLKARTIARASRNGQGPNEYVSTFGLTRTLGDTLYLYDPRGHHFLRIDKTGKIVGDVQMDPGIIRGGISLPHGADARGRLYWDGGVVVQDPVRGFKRSLTAQVRRWVPGRDTFDVVATVADHAVAMGAFKFFPYAERDAWVVAPDGRIGVVVAADYHLRWVENGTVVSDGPRIPFTPIPINAEERAAFRDERALAPAGNAQMTGPPPANGSAQDAIKRQTMEQTYPDPMFPKFKPPFEEGGAFLSPRGDVWVVRTRPTGERTATVDILDRTGALRGSLRLPPSRRIVSLERGGIYLARVDDDGLEWIERYAWPADLK